MRRPSTSPPSPPPVAFSLPTPVPHDNPSLKRNGESHFDFALRSFHELSRFIARQLVQTLSMDAGQANETSVLYTETLALAEFDVNSLGELITNFTPPQPEFEGEPAQTVYGYLLEALRDIPFEKYPRQLSDSNLDTHQTNIVRICLEYFSQAAKSKSPSPATVSSAPRAVGEEEEGFIGPLPSTEVIPVGANTENQLPQRRYVLMSVAVDTISVEGRLVVWQISVHIPGLPEDNDPDYECLMLPAALADRPQQLNELGFTSDPEKKVNYHQGTEFGRRRADSEEVSLEKFANYLDVSFPHSLCIYFLIDSVEYVAGL